MNGDNTQCQEKNLHTIDKYWFMFPINDGTEQYCNIWFLPNIKSGDS